MQDKKDLCKCGSRQIESECCYQENPPIARSAIRVNSLNLTSTVQLIDPFGRVIPLQVPITTSGRLKVSDVLVIEDHVYLLFKQAIGNIMAQLPPYVQVTPRLKTLLREKTLIENLYRNTTAVRYHQQNFIYRFNRISSEFQQKPFIVTGTEITIVDEDAPLELEFEAFMIRYRTVVELVFKAISFKVLKESYTKKISVGSVISAVRKHQKDQACAKLADIFSKFNDWLNQQRLIRNKIVHDGELSALQAFEHVHGKTLEATILDRTADETCFELFNTLLRFIDDTMSILYPLTK